MLASAKRTDKLALCLGAMCGASATKPFCVFSLFFGYFIASQFFVGASFVYDMTFYLPVIGAMAYAVLSNSARINLNSRWALLLFAPFLFIPIHIALIAPAHYHLLDSFRHIIANSAFVLACLLFFRLPDTCLRHWFKLWLTTALITGIYAISAYVLSHGWPERLTPFGQNDHAILGSNVFAMITLGGSFLWLSKKDYTSGENRLLIATIFCSTLLIVLTHSRGPLAAFMICLVLAMMMSRQWKMLALGSLAALLVGADMMRYFMVGVHLLPLESLYEAVQYMYQRPSYRSAIWMEAIARISERPWTGYGLHAPFHVAPGGVNPHNLFLSTAYYLGIPGLLVLLTSIFGALYYCWQQREQTLAKVAFILLIHAILACMTDQGEYVKSPSPLWSIFWLPLAIAYSLALRKPDQKRSVGHA